MEGGEKMKAKLYDHLDNLLTFNQKLLDDLEKDNCLDVASKITCLGVLIDNAQELKKI